MGRTTDTAKDQELLSILRQNARMPISDIAKRLGVSRATAQARLVRLERESVIAGYTVVSGPAATANALFAIVLVELEAKRQIAVVAELRRMPEVVSCYTLSGQFDLYVRIRCRVAAELDSLIDAIAQIEGVRRTTSSVMLSRKFER